MILTPRDYQIDAFKAFIAHTKTGAKSGLIQAATGAGKALILSMISEHLIKHGHRVLILCHSAEVLVSNFKTLWSGNASMYCAGLGSKDKSAPIVVASRDSFVRMKDPGHFAVVIVDECHLISGKGSYEKILERTTPRYLLGLTATPYRMDNGLIYGTGKIFEKMIFNIGTQFLIDKGFLCPFIWPEIDKLVDVSKVKKVAGDYDSDAQGKLYDEPVVREAIKKWELFDRKLSLFFCCSIAHAELVHSMISNSVLITGKTKASDRAIIYKDIEAGRYRAIINVGVLTTGFNMPAIDCAVFMRATQSASLWVQCLGRVLRTHESKSNSLILDFAGNYERFGHPDNPMILRKGKKPDEEAIEQMLDGLMGPVTPESEAPSKECSKCGSRWPVAKRKCDNCNSLFLSHSSELFSEKEWIKVDSFYMESKSTKDMRPALVVYYLSQGKRYQEWFVDGNVWQQSKKRERMAQVKAKAIEAIKVKEGTPFVRLVKAKSNQHV